MPVPHFPPVAQQPAATQPAVQQPAASAPMASRLGGVDPVTERRPLSSFAAPEPQATTSFEPMFEVDGFRWPKITDQVLSEHSELLIPVAEHLLDICEQGRSLIGMVGTRPSVGCSTLMLSLARLVGSAGKSVALVDANFTKASLGSDLGMEFEQGWEHVLTGELPLAECAVKSLDDRMTLLPLTAPRDNAHQLLASIHTSVTAGVLRYHYDVVLFNLGAGDLAPQNYAAHAVVQGCKIDAGIIVADNQRTGIDPMDSLLSLFGSNCLGVIGNSAA